MSTGQTDESDSCRTPLRYSRSELLRMYGRSDHPPALLVPDYLLAPAHPPCLDPAQPFTHNLGANLNSRPVVKDKRPEGMPDWQRSKPHKAVYFHPPKAAPLPAPVTSSTRPLRVVLNTDSRNVPTDLKLPNTAVIFPENTRSRLNPDAESWKCQVDTQYPRYHIALLQEKTLSGDPFSSILLESGIVDSTGFVSLPSYSRASERTWFYRDPQGLIQGPFSAIEMFNWHAAGYFPLDLPVAFNTNTTFRPLTSYLRRES